MRKKRTLKNTNKAVILKFKKGEILIHLKKSGKMNKKWNHYTKMTNLISKTNMTCSRKMLKYTREECPLQNNPKIFFKRLYF